MHRFEWADDGSVTFDLPYGEWVRLFGRSGLTAEDLIEIRPPEGASPGRFEFSLEWARRWPSEEIWKTRKRVGPPSAAAPRPAAASALAGRRTWGWR